MNSLFKILNGFYFAVFLIALTVYLPLNAQNSEIDSLLFKLKTADAFKQADLLCQLTEICDEADVLKYARLTMKAALSSNNKAALACGYNNMGYGFNESESFDSAIFYLPKALDIRRNLKDTAGVVESLNTLSGIYYKIGNVNKFNQLLNESLSLQKDTLTESYLISLNSLAEGKRRLGLFKEASEIFHRTVNIASHLKLKRFTAQAFNSYGHCQVELGKLNEALLSFQKSDSITVPNKYYSEYINALNGRTVAYIRLGDIEKAISISDSAIDLAKTKGLKIDLITAYGNKAFIYQEYNDFTNALKFSQLRLKTIYDNQLKSELALSFNNLGNLYLRKHDFNNAVINFKASINEALGTNDNRVLSMAYNNLANLYIQTHNNDSSLFYNNKSLEAALHIDDKRAIAFAYLNLSDYYSSQESYTLSHANALLALNIAKELGYPDLLKRASSRLAQLYAQTGDFKNAFEMQKVMMEANSKILNDGIKEKLLKSSLQYEYKQKEDSTRLEQKRIALLNELKLDEEKNKRKSLGLIFVIVMAAALVSFLFYKKRNEALEAAHISAAKLKTVNAQLNTHFVTNAFNSIKAVTLLSPHKTSGHIAAYAAYFRKILEFSDVRLVPVKDELELTSQYLQLELEDDPEKFEFFIQNNLPPNVLPAITPILLQPIVENCIKHGFSGIKYKGKININISKENNMIVIDVTDNGKGLNPDAKPGSSFGTKLTQERIKLFNINRKSKATYQISPLAQGTGVKIIFPLITKPEKYV